jgi:S1-C subfamily serine protease
MNELITKGSVEHAYIGVSYQQVDAQIAAALNLGQAQGVVVMQVVPGTPAAKAGVQENDVITAVNGQPIDPDHTFASVLSRRRVGETVTLTILRNGRQMSVPLVLSSRPVTQ